MDEKGYQCYCLDMNPAKYNNLPGKYVHMCNSGMTFKVVTYHSLIRFEAH